MNLLLSLLMIVFTLASAGLALLVRNGSTGLKPAAAGSAGLALLFSLFRLLQSGDDTTDRSYAAYETIQGKVIADRVAADFPGGRVMVLTPPEDLDPSGSASGALVTALTSALVDLGLQVQVESIRIPSELLERQEELAAVSPSVWFDGRQLGLRLLELQQEADVVICILDYSSGLDPRWLPRKGQAPALILPKVWMENPDPVLKQTVLHALILPRNDPEAWVPDLKIPRNPDQAFSLRYRWITGNAVRN